MFLCFYVFLLVLSKNLSIDKFLDKTNKNIKNIKHILTNKPFVIIKETMFQAQAA